MKIGVFTVSMPEYDIPDTIKVLKELGYDGVEWKVSPPAPVEKPENYSFDNRYWSYNLSTIDTNKIESVANEIKGQCRNSGIEIYSLTTYLTLWDIEEIQKVIRAAKIMECGIIRVNLPFYDEKDNYNCVFDRAKEQAKVVEKLAEASNVKIVFETHMGGIIPSASAAYRFVSGFNPEHIGVIYDPGNMVYEGFENYKIGVELLGKYLANVHLKNASWNFSGTDEDGIDSWTPEASTLKKGSANLKKLVEILKGAGYQGFLSVEDFSNDEDTYTKLKNNIGFIKLLLGQV